MSLGYSKGDEYGSKADAEDVVYRQQPAPVTKVRSDQKRFTLVCKTEGCSFYTSVNRQADAVWRVSKLEEHTCAGLVASQYGACNVAARAVRAFVAADPSMKPKEVRRLMDVHSQGNVQLTYKQVYL
eukprot:TRINITY_DN5877_c0_g1_i1.p1 TRINITY_DN5877_c0_g1~~TRINITY_DN5877_c0_g1_i1.p1  ORF type:complete len:127 (-),score=34.30 TRINITY_DN5877_c0_g1_i1:55-435(-)